MKSDNHANVNNQVEGVVLAYARVGEHASGSGGVTHAEGDVQQAGIHSMAPYKPPARRRRDNPKLLLCSHEGCKGYHYSKTVPYCQGHARALGLLKLTCEVYKGEQQCRMPAKKGTTLCPGHTKQRENRRKEAENEAVGTS